MENSTILEHPAEEALERFVLNQSNETELEVVETHFLACEACVIRLENIEYQIVTTKLALQELHKEKVAKAVAREQSKNRKWFSVPGLSMAGAVAALALAIAIVPRVGSHTSAVSEVNLVAYRGSETPVVPKNRLLHVRLNANDLNQTAVRVLLVDESGTEVWSGESAIQQNQAEVNVPDIRQTGAHFFRLYASGSNNSLLREFPFRVE